MRHKARNFTRRLINRLRGVHLAQDEYTPILSDDDAFLISFPRSGNTWMRHMLTVLHPGLSGEDERNIHTVIPNLDQRPDLDQTPKPRLIKTHSPYDSRFRRVIYMLRDGRDVVFSYYKFFQKEHGFGGSFLEFLESQATVFGYRWEQHVNSWLRDNQGTELLVVRYEDMQIDPLQELRRVLYFLNWEVSDLELEAAVEQSRFDRMKMKQDRGAFLGHVRSGQVGGWKKNYSSEELDLMLATAANTLRELGYLE